MKFKDKITGFVLEVASFLIVLVVALVFAIALSGCSNNPQEQELLPDTNRDTVHVQYYGQYIVHRNVFNAIKFEYGGHQYIFFRGPQRGWTGFVHDPDCKCV